MEYINYFVKVNVAIVLLYCVYRVLFQKDTFFAWKRVILLSMIAFAFAYPFFQFFSFFANDAKLLENNVVPSISLGDISITSIETDATPSMSLLQIVNVVLKFVYFSGLAFFVVRFITQIISILRIIYAARKERFFGQEVLVSDQIDAPLSFFNKIVINNNAYSETELNEILLHEQTHVHQLHSVDVILSELLCIFAWFNPFAWLLKREIRLNLEFLADHAVLLSGCETAHYQLNLVQLSFHKNLTTITNNFNVSPLKKRIIMMKKNESSRKSMWKYTLLLPATALLIGFNVPTSAGNRNQTEKMVENGATYFAPETSVTTKTPPENEPILENPEKLPVLLDKDGDEDDIMEYLGYNLKYPAEAMKAQVNIRVVYSFVVETDGTVSNIKWLTTHVEKDSDNPGVIAAKKACQKETERLIASTSGKWKAAVQGGKSVRFSMTLPVWFKFHTENEQVPASVVKDDVFMQVEKMPEFPGGIQALYKYIAENLHYPDIARESAIQGKTVVRFIVEKDGSVSDVTVLRGFDKACDKEAVRVIESLPKFLPGKQNGNSVRVYFTIPITFQLKKE
ncbi:MAG: M56 family metallopeptidase, partial [Prevotellaceae bacterium]|nr:M56 family metallopeptidase [Prevotellaceae bacterium]